MDSDIDRAVADAIKPVQHRLERAERTIHDLEKKLADAERSIKTIEKSFADLLRKLNPRNR